MSKKLIKKPAIEKGKYSLGDYNFDDGKDPRDYLPGVKSVSSGTKSGKLFHDSWAEELAKKS